MPSAQAYRDQLLALCPPGAALPDDPSSTWGKLLDALALELARVDERTDDLLAETDPRAALELLTDWERVLGLPGQCGGTARTLAERRMAAHAALVAQGGATPAYLRAVAAALGYPDVVVEEFVPARADHLTAGGAVYAESWHHAFRLLLSATAVRRFKAGSGMSGDALATWGDERLVCEIGRVAPAQTVPIIAYTAAEVV